MDKTAALFLLKIFSLIWNKYFAPAATAAVNTAVANRLAALTNAVLAGNLPDISWARALKYVQVADGSIIQATLSPSGAWTADQWRRLIEVKRSDLADLQGQIESLPQPKSVPDQETLNFYNSSLVGEAESQLQELAAQAQAQISEMESWL